MCIWGTNCFVISTHLAAILSRSGNSINISVLICVSLLLEDLSHKLKLKHERNVFNMKNIDELSISSTHTSKDKQMQPFYIFVILYLFFFFSSVNFGPCRFKKKQQLHDKTCTTSLNYEEVEFMLSQQPSWMGDSSFLVSWTLIGCAQLSCLSK